MAIVTSYDWESDSWTHHNGDNPARQAWREAVAEIAEKAKATLPECNGRVDSAVKIVLHGDVELLADGTAKVASQSNGQTVYHIVNGGCDCKDYPKAPSNWCKHKISAGIAKRAYALAKTKLEATTAQQNGHTEHQPATEQPQGETAPALPQGEAVSTLPEAPASANCHITIEGRQVQVTLRDTDETRLLTRLQTLLQQYPVAPPPQPPAQGTAQPSHQDDHPYCYTHKVALTRFTKDGRTWYSHKVPDGSWCKGQ